MATVSKVSRENDRLQSQVSMSNVESVKKAQYAQRQAEQQAKQYEDDAKRANERADNAENKAKRKYEDKALDTRYKYQLLGFYALVVTILTFVTTARCRADTLDFIDQIGTIIAAVFQWEISMFADGILYIIVSLVCMVVIPILVLIGFILLGIAYKKVCIDNFMDVEGAKFRTEIVALCSVIVPIYLIGFTPQGINLWGITILVQTAYFVMCLVYNREG